MRRGKKNSSSAAQLHHFSTFFPTTSYLLNLPVSYCPAPAAEASAAPAVALSAVLLVARLGQAARRFAGARTDGGEECLR
jgi:hypothetical protein